MNEFSGLIQTYEAPISNYEPPLERDPNFEILKTDYVEPYWIDALTMHNGEEVVEALLENSNREIKYVFSQTAPSYIVSTVTGYKLATPQMQQASKEIFENLSKI